jgi:hypothetical protein
VTSESHDVSPEPSKAESTAALATEGNNEAEVIVSASVNLDKAPCKYDCRNSNTTRNAFECMFLYYSFALKVEESYKKKPT